jgi:hypothetical protein
VSEVTWVTVGLTFPFSYSGDIVGSFTSFDDPLDGSTGRIIDLDAGDIRYFLTSGGLISNRDKSMKLVYNAMHIEDRSKEDPTPVLIDHWSFRSFPFVKGGTPTKMSMDKELRDLLRTAIGSGTAYPQVLNHYVCYALFGLGRLLRIFSDGDSRRPHVFDFETTRAARRQVWNLGKYRASGGEIALEDSKVVDGIAQAFEWQARKIRKTKDDTIPAGHSGFCFHSLPVARQGTNRGCAVSAIVNAHVASSLRRDLLEAVNEAPFGYVEYEAGEKNMDELWDRVE